MNFKVPVVAIFTKMDAIDKKIFNKLTMTDGVPFSVAKKQVPSAAKAKFEMDFLEPLKKVKHGPAQIVKLRGGLFLSLYLCSPSYPLSTQTCTKQTKIAMISL